MCNFCGEFLIKQKIQTTFGGEVVAPLEVKAGEVKLRAGPYEIAIAKENVIVSGVDWSKIELISHNLKEPAFKIPFEEIPVNFAEGTKGVVKFRNFMGEGPLFAGDVLTPKLRVSVANGDKGENGVYDKAEALAVAVKDILLDPEIKKLLTEAEILGIKGRKLS